MATEDARIRLSLETSESRRQIDRFRADFKAATKDAEALGAAAAGGFGGAFRQAAAGVAAGAARGFTQGVRGAGVGGGLSEGAINAGEATLDTLSETIGEVRPFGLPIGKLLQGGFDLASKGARDRLRTVGRAQAAAIAEVTGRFGPGAERGGQIDPEVFALAMEQAFERAMRRINFEAQAREKGGQLALKELGRGFGGS